MVADRWQSKVDALIRLAHPDSGATPAERDTAQRKLREILRNHPQAERIRQYGPVREFLTTDLVWMKRHGISVEGSWTGRNLEEAARTMVADYWRRIVEANRRKRLLGNERREWERSGWKTSKLSISRAE